jgi:transposase
MSELKDILVRGALAYGFDTDLWTLPRVAAVLEKEWGIRYSRSGVWLLLKNQGYSWQRPQRQAREKDPAKVAHWTRYTWARLKKKPVDDVQ